MFGKHFESLYSGSMVGAGACVFAVWGYVIAATTRGYVELNPKLLSLVIGESMDSISRAIEYLQQPDPESRSKENEGKRLIREGQFIYFVPTHEKYRKIRDQIERRRYMRNLMKAKRNVKLVSKTSPVSHRLAHTEAEAEAESNKEYKPLSLAKPRSNGRSSDEDFLNQLRKNPAYAGLDLDRELAKMDAWLLTPKGRRRKKTRGFIVNWLNRVDIPVQKKQTKDQVKSYAQMLREAGEKDAVQKS